MDVERLPFDQYQRYRLVADLIDEVRGGRGPLHILDVGGRTALLREFLPNDRVVLVDMEPSESRGLVLGDGSCLPFRAGAFDVVAAFDTLEHVPPPRRAAFVEECARVSRGHVFLAGPYQAPRVDEAEEVLLDFLRNKLRVKHRYLEEHRAYGLPDRAAAEAGLRATGLTAASIGHGNLDRWLMLMSVEFYLDYDPTLRALGERVFKFYNASLYASDYLEPVYRHVVVGARPGFAVPDVARVLATPGAPPEAMPALLPLAQELLAFDHQRDALAPELARLHGVVESLAEDLRQHDAVAQTLATDLDAHRASVAALRAELESERRQQADIGRAHAADLAGHRALIDALRAEIEKHQRVQRGLGSEIEKHERVQRELGREIETRGAALEELRAELRRVQAHAVELRAHADALAQRAELSGELELELSEHRKLRRLLDADLEQHRRELTSRGHLLADREARVDDLHSELTASLERARAAEEEVDALRADAARLVALLRDRAGNLRRAFAPRKFGDPPPERRGGPGAG